MLPCHSQIPVLSPIQSTAGRVCQRGLLSPDLEVTEMTRTSQASPCLLGLCDPGKPGSHLLGPHYGLLKLLSYAHSSADGGIRFPVDAFTFQISLHNICLKPIKTDSSEKSQGGQRLFYTLSHPDMPSCWIQFRRQCPLWPLSRWHCSVTLLSPRMKPSSSPSRLVWIMTKIAKGGQRRTGGGD